MKFKMIVLGSSGGAPTKKRNCSAFVLALETYGILFDCAEGTQRQILLAGYKLSKIRYIFITHLHLDHIAGLVPLLSTKSMFGIPGDISIFGPKGLGDYIEYNLGISGSKLHFSITVTEIGEGSETVQEDFSVSAHLLNHRLTSFGFRLKFKDAPGNILSEKLKEFGISEGPVCGTLKSGGTVTVSGGREIILKDVATPGRPGKIISFAGDTYLCKGLYACVKGADLAVIESTFLDNESERAKERTHLTALMAGNVCERSGVKKILLYHFSASYPAPEIFREECALKFSGDIFLSHDMDEIEIE